MIIRMDGTNTARVGLRLDELREAASSSVPGRALTLTIIAKNVGGVHDAIASAADAAWAHPYRIIAILPIDGEEPKIGAGLRIGPEADLSEAAILRCSSGSADSLETLVIPLLLPDAPVVVWWVQDAPENPSRTPIGVIVQRRIATAQNSGIPADEILRRVRGDYAPGDTDLAWTGVTFWKNHLAVILDEPPHEVIERVVMRGNRTHPTMVFLAAWLALRLEVPAEIERTQGTAIDGVSVFHSSGELRLDRLIGSDFGDMVRPDCEIQRVNLIMRTMEPKVIEELREMTPDTAYEEILRHGLERVLPSGE